MAYASLDELKQALDVGDTANDVDLARALDAATAWIDDHTGRTFGLTGPSVARLFDATETTRLDVTDLVSTAPTIEIDTSGDRTYATDLTTADYVLYPYDGPRYQEIRIWPTSSRSFSPGRLVRVTGQWGYAEAGTVPRAVNQACLLYAARLYKRREAPFGVLQSAALEAFQRIPTQDADVEALLEPYVRSRSGAAVWVLV